MLTRGQLNKYLALYFKSTQSVLEKCRDYRVEFLNQLTLDDDNKNTFIDQCKKDELAFFQLVIEQIIFKNTNNLNNLPSQYAQIHEHLFEQFRTILLLNGIIKIQTKLTDDDNQDLDASHSLHDGMDESFLEISDNFSATSQNSETDDLSNAIISSEPIIDPHRDMTSIDSTSQSQASLGKDKIQSLEFEIMQLEGCVEEMKFERDEARKKITLLEAQLIEALEICIKNNKLDVSESELCIENARELLEIIKKAA